MEWPAPEALVLIATIWGLIGAGIFLVAGFVVLAYRAARRWWRRRDGAPRPS